MKEGERASCVIIRSKQGTLNRPVFYLQEIYSQEFIYRWLALVIATQCLTSFQKEGRMKPVTTTRYARKKKKKNTPVGRIRA